MNNDIIVSRAAIQQALVLELGCSYRKAAGVAGVSHRTVWQHVNGCDRGANLRSWNRRTKSEQNYAINKATRLLADYDYREQNEMGDTD